MGNKWIIFFLVITSAAAGIYYHTNTLEVSHHKVVMNNGTRKLRVAHISDLHTNGMGSLERQLVNVLGNKKPDIIVITGDLATPSGTIEGYESVLKELKAPKGVFFVRGNWEFWEPIYELEKIFRRTHITNLTNKSYQIGPDLWITGFDDSEEGDPEINIINKIPKSAFKIGIFHSPAFFEKIAGKTSLNLAGHSHGGQFRFPYVGHLWVPEGTGNFVEGWFEKNQSKLFVSRGIGTSVLPIRVNCSPELAIIDIMY